MRYEHEFRNEGHRVVWSMKQIPDTRERLYVDPSKVHVVNVDGRNLYVLNPDWATLLTYRD